MRDLVKKKYIDVACYSCLRRAVPVDLLEVDEAVALDAELVPARSCRRTRPGLGHAPRRVGPVVAVGHHKRVREVGDGRAQAVKDGRERLRGTWK
jgi:hypothetical protein